MKIGRPKNMPCPCCGQPVLTESALQMVVALYVARESGWHPTLYEVEKTTGLCVRTQRRVIVEFRHLFFKSFLSRSTHGRSAQVQHWSLSAAGVRVAQRLTAEWCKEVA